MIERTRIHELADLKLGDQGPTLRFLRERRDAGVAWRHIERELHDLTGLDLTYETLRAWYHDADEAKS